MFKCWREVLKLDDLWRKQKGGAVVIELKTNSSVFLLVIPILRQRQANDIWLFLNKK